MSKSIYGGHPIFVGHSNESLKSLKQIDGVDRTFQGFDEKIVKKLANLQVTDWEQLYSILLVENLSSNLHEELELESIDALDRVKVFVGQQIPERIRESLEDELPLYALGARKPKEQNISRDIFWGRDVKADNEIKNLKGEMFPDFSWQIQSIMFVGFHQLKIRVRTGEPVVPLR